MYFLVKFFSRPGHALCSYNTSCFLIKPLALVKLQKLRLWVSLTSKSVHSFRSYGLEHWGFHHWSKKNYVFLSPIVLSCLPLNDAVPIHIVRNKRHQQWFSLACSKEYSVFGQNWNLLGQPLREKWAKLPQWSLGQPKSKIAQGSLCAKIGQNDRKSSLKAHLAQIF